MKPARHARCPSPVESVIRDADVLESWRDRPGHMSRALSNAVIFACVVTVMVAAFGGYFLWERYGHQEDDWSPVVLALFAIGWISITALPRWQLARLLRVAVLLPVAHLLAMVAAWIAWHLVKAPVEYYFEPHVTMLEVVPIGGVVAGALALFAALAHVIARGRRGEPVHAFVMLALATLLVFGLWLPIASAIAWYEPKLQLGSDTPGATAMLTLGPPIALATLFTAIAFRRPALHARLRWLFGLVVFVLFGLAIATRMGRADNPYALFGSMIHVAFALAFVAVVSLVVLGAATWLRARRAAASFGPGALAGTVAPDDDAEVGCFEIASWLRGPRPVLRPFTLITPNGGTMIHGGAQLVTPLPAATTQLDVGESIVMLRPGDAVVISGLDVAGGDSPYRTLATAVGGASGVLVGRAGQHYGFAHVALTVWRPCVAYLVILLAVGIPGLLAAGAFS